MTSYNFYGWCSRERPNETEISVDERRDNGVVKEENTYSVTNNYNALLLPHINKKQCIGLVKINSNNVDNNNDRSYHINAFYANGTQISGGNYEHNNIKMYEELPYDMKLQENETNMIMDNHVIPERNSIPFQKQTNFPILTVVNNDCDNAGVRTEMPNANEYTRDTIDKTDAAANLCRNMGIGEPFFTIQSGATMNNGVNITYCPDSTNMNHRKKTQKKKKKNVNEELNTSTIYHDVYSYNDNNVQRKKQQQNMNEPNVIDVADASQKYVVIDSDNGFQSTKILLDGKREEEKKDVRFYTSHLSKETQMISASKENDGVNFVGRSVGCIPVVVGANETHTYVKKDGTSPNAQRPMESLPLEHNDTYNKYLQNTQLVFNPQNVNTSLREFQHLRNTSSTTDTCENPVANKLNTEFQYLSRKAITGAFDKTPWGINDNPPMNPVQNQQKYLMPSTTESAKACITGIRKPVKKRNIEMKEAEEEIDSHSIKRKKRCGRLRQMAISKECARQNSLHGRGRTRSRLERTENKLNQNPHIIMFDELLPNIKNSTRQNKKMSLSMKHLTHFPVEQALKQPMENGVENPTHYSMKSPTQVPLYNLTPNLIQDTVEDPIEFPLESSVENPMGKGIQDTMRYPREMPMESPIKNPVGHSMPSLIQDPMKDSVKDLVPNLIQNSMEYYIVNPIQGPLTYCMPTLIQDPVKNYMTIPLHTPVEGYMTSQAQSLVKECIPSSMHETMDGYMPTLIQDPAEDLVQLLSQSSTGQQEYYKEIPCIKNPVYKDEIYKNAYWPQKTDYNVSVKEFIGDSNISVVLRIFPQISDILEQTSDRKEVCPFYGDVEMLVGNNSDSADNKNNNNNT